MFYNVECIMNGEVFGVVLPKNPNVSQYNRHKFEISKEESLRIKGCGERSRTQEVLSKVRKDIEKELGKKFNNFEIVIPRENSQFAHFKTAPIANQHYGTWGVTKILAVNGTGES